MASANFSIKEGMIKENLYKILGLPNFTHASEIKKAYRMLVMKHHPDRGGDLEIMKKINMAYQILSEKKEEYDTRLRGGFMPKVIIQYRSYNQGFFDATGNGTTGFTWTFQSGN